MTDNRTVPGYALLRLLWRPMSAFLLLAAVWVTVFPWIFLPEEPESWMGPQSPLRILEFHYALWQDAILLPIVTGGLVSGMTHEALQSGVSWMLPRYRSRILQPTVLTTIVFALLVSVAIALLISWHAGLAALGIATLSFAIGWRVFDPAASNFFRAGAAVVVFAVIRRPAYLLAAVEANPGTIALLATSAGIALLWIGLTTPYARELALRPRTVGGLPEKLKGRDDLPWERFGAQVEPPALVGLVRAGLYESTRIRRLGRFPEMILQIVFLGVIGWVFRASSMVAGLPIIFVGLAGSQLKDVFPYPISRKQKADTFFLASLIDATTVASLSATAVLLIDKMGWWRETPSPIQRTPLDALIGLLFLFLFVPILQLPLTFGPPTSTRKKKISTRRLIVFVSAMGLWLVTARIARSQLDPLIDQSPSFTIATVVLVLFLLIQIVFWASLRFMFARRNFG